MAAEGDGPNGGPGRTFPREAQIALVMVLSPQLGLATLQLALPVLAPLITAEAQLAPEWVGVLSGLTNLGAIWHFAANHAVTPVLGSIRALQLSILIAGVGAAFALTGAVPALCLGAVLIGFAYATTAPAGSEILVSNTPRALRGTLFSIRQAGVPVGGVIAGGLTAWLAVGLGWRTVFALFTAICLASGAVLLFAPAKLRGTGNGARFRPAALLDPLNVLRPFRAVGGRPALIRIAAASVGFAAIQTACLSFFVTYLTAGVGLSVVLAGSLFAVLQASSIVGRILVGALADWIGSARRTLVGLGLASSLLCAAHPLIAADWPVVGMFLFAGLAGLAIATWNGLFLAEVADAAPEGEIAEATAGTTFFTFASYMVVPPLFGLLVHVGGYGAAYPATALLGLMAAAILMGEARART